MPRARRLGVDAGEHLADEVVDDALPFLRGQPGEPVHECQLLGRATSFRDQPQHGPAEPQHADLRVQGGGVRPGDLGERGLPGEDPLHGGEVEPQLAEGAHQVDPGGASAS